MKKIIVFILLVGVIVSLIIAANLGSVGVVKASTDGWSPIPLLGGEFLAYQIEGERPHMVECKPAHVSECRFVFYEYVGGTAWQTYMNPPEIIIPSTGVRIETYLEPRIYCISGSIQVTSNLETKWLMPDPWEYQNYLSLIGRFWGSDMNIPVTPVPYPHP